MKVQYSRRWYSGSACGRCARPEQVSIGVIDGHETDENELRSDPNNVAVMDADSVFQLVHAARGANAASGPLDNVGASTCRWDCWR